MNCSEHRHLQDFAGFYRFLRVLRQKSSKNCTEAILETTVKPVKIDYFSMSDHVHLKDVHFTHGTSMAAVEFLPVQSKLSRYMGSKSKGAMGAKAIMSLKNPNLAEPIRPIRVMKKVISDGVETKELVWRQQNSRRSSQNFLGTWGVRRRERWVRKQL